MEYKVSKAQLEVWEWKEALWKSVDHLPTMQEKVAAINEQAKETIALLRQLRRGKKVKHN